MEYWEFVVPEFEAAHCLGHKYMNSMSFLLNYFKGHFNFQENIP